MKNLIILVLLVSLLSLFSLTNKKKLQKITIAEANQPMFAVLYVAKEKGFFEKHGLEVIFKEYTLGRDALKDMLNDKANFATVFDTPVVLNLMEGKDVAIISSLHFSYRNTALVANREKGIEKVVDLKGKKIGVPRNTNFEFFLYTLITETNGIEISDVEIIDIPPEAMIKSISEGKVDAIAIGNPYYSLAEKKLKEKHITFYSDVFTEYSVLAGKKEYILKNKEKTQKLINALIEAENYIKENQEDSKKIVAKNIGLKNSDEISENWSDYVIRLSLDNSLIVGLKHQEKWFIREGNKGSLPETKNFIFSDFLKSRYPERVTLF